MNNDPLPPEFLDEVRRTRRYLDVFRSETCEACGAPKHSGKCFCYGCFKSLSHSLQRGLYKRFGAGYEEAYDAALAALSPAPTPAPEVRQ